MEPPPGLCNSELLNCTNFRSVSFSTSSSLYQPDYTAQDSAAGKDGHRQTALAATQDPFAYYRAFTDPCIQLGSNTHDYTHIDDIYTSDTIPAEDALAGARAVPYNLAVRLANRSNGAPLATIIEQGSYSTLNSRNSLVSVGRFPSLKVAENKSPKRASHGASRSLDERVLRKQREDALREQGLGAHGPSYEKTTQENRDNPVWVTDTASQIGDIPLQHPKLSKAPIDDLDYDVDSNTLKGFLRGVLQNVRARSRSRSRSSLKVHTTADVEFHNGRLEASDDGPLNQLHASETHETKFDKFDNSFPAHASFSSAILTPTLDSQARNRTVSAEHSESSACAYPLLNEPPPIVKPRTGTGSVSHLLPPSIATCSRERPSSVRLVQPKPRDAAFEGGTPLASTLSNKSWDDTSARHTFYGVPVLPSSAPSLVESDRRRESNGNPSFCSTLSTSYSGTVLGVDVDLQHELTHAMRRSCSPTPAAPVWFTPQVAELERQATSESPPSHEVAAIDVSLRSITSSALTSLLPIAAASGIVRPNYNTPRISFYSPSGNLIQPEDTSTPGTSGSEVGYSPTITTSYYNKIPPTAYNLASATTSLPAPRPALMPMTTPPTSTSPLPVHLRHHHNYRHATKSQIGSCESVLEPAPAVKGCGGVVRNSSITPRSGYRGADTKTEFSSSTQHRRSSRSVARDLHYEMNFHKARLIGLAARSCGPSARAGRTLQKRQSIHNTTTSDGYAYPPTATGTSGRATASSVHPSTSTENQQREKARNKQPSQLGPLAAHALRICFCQPYDGAGTSCLADPTTAQPTCKNGSNRQRATELDADLPNARVVNANSRAGNDTAVRRRKDGANDVSGHGRARSDSAVSVSAGVTVGLRVAAVGG